MSFSQILSAELKGLEVKFIRVEADLSNGLPAFHMVGYLSAEVKEAGERVRTAIRNLGIQMPAKKIIINLSPGNVRKRGASFDLPIALAILVSMGVIEEEKLSGTLVTGELGLKGEIRPVAGVLPIVDEARRAGVSACIVPEDNLREGSLINGIKVIGAGSLSGLCDYLREGRKRKKEPCAGVPAVQPEHNTADFCDIKGQKAVKRAAEIAVAGGHNLLMMGPPGSGKSMIASRIPTILPPLTMEESLEITKIYSIQGLLEKNQPLITRRPFREVHHTATKSSLIGGGNIPGPGEITLASKGVLFLDELAEFPKAVLEALRQPLEERRIQIVRSQGTYVFPADFMLVAATNPCPCGNYPDFNKCICTPYQVRQYLGKLSQPFLSRIDICIEVPKLKYDVLSGTGKEETSEQIRSRIVRARKRQQDRYQEAGISANAALNTEGIKNYCALGKEQEKMMSSAYRTLELTARTYHKVLKVARTIADLDEKETIENRHLREALSYRMLDKKYWGRV